MKNTELVFERLKENGIDIKSALKEIEALYLEMYTMSKEIYDKIDKLSVDDNGNVVDMDMLEMSLIWQGMAGLRQIEEFLIGTGAIKNG